MNESDGRRAAELSNWTETESTTPLIFVAPYRRRTLETPDISPAPELPAVASAKPSGSREREGSSTPPVATPKQEREKQPTVTLHGRVAATPVLRKTLKTDRDILEFPFALHPDANSTSYVRVIFFGEKAVKLKDKFQRGAEYTIKGYEHTRERKRRDGTVRTEPELYGVAVLTH
jgi:Single-strand binding protein family